MISKTETTQWQFWIDVGGTFTDCIGRSPDGQLYSHKLLSNGVTKGTIAQPVHPNGFIDPLRTNDPPEFWIGYRLLLLDKQGQLITSSEVTGYDHREGSFMLADSCLTAESAGKAYQLVSGEDAPIIAIRYLMGLRRDAGIPHVSVRLGTTRGTNALLTRKGARTAFVTTRGFADILQIGYQDRPELFALNIVKPQPLYDTVLEIDARVAADGTVLQSLDLPLIRKQLLALKNSGIDSLAICLLHAFAYPNQEQAVEAIARDVGFVEISASSNVAPLIKLVSRGDTTVADAYLNPVLREYVAGLRQTLKGSDLKIMTSAGGLVSAEHFVGKDSILSGPAGGVIGFARVAVRAGFPQAIGFDMGGTSTDVARYGGRYDYEFETQKAGVRVVAPMLAIETVAAGGGSICDFDGVKLCVGPDSAGADPGPACYGNGGPLTVTDCNFYLGKILPERFPFPLNKRIVEQKLMQLCEKIAITANSQRMSPAQLAEGFLKVANANMVRAIRNRSVAKGYNPKEHVLITFGGAGAQHCCAIAQSLGIRQILIHPFAGILSAYGIGMADVRRFAERAVLKSWETFNKTIREKLFTELEQQAREDVLNQGVTESQLQPPVRSLAMRYQGAETTVNVVEPEGVSYAERFAQLHQQQFGFVRIGKAIEVVVARVEVTGKQSEFEDEIVDSHARRPEPVTMADVWFSGANHRTAVFERDQLCAGDQIEGPAIVCEPTSTVVIDPGFQAEVTDRGEILITDLGENLTVAVTADVDPVMLEIFNNLFASIAEQMGTTLEQTAFSTNIKERRDFSCALFSANGDLVANAPHVPVHLGAMSETVKCILADNPAMQPGDVYLTNDPYRGGSHLPDVTVVTPVHDDQTGELIFFTASRAHHAEIGGIVPGSLPPFSKNLAEEGVLIRNFQLVASGESHEAELKKLFATSPYPSRSVEENLADITAQLAANQKGAGLLQELVSRYSLNVVLQYMQHIQDAATQKMQQALKAIPDGSYQRTDHMDDGTPVEVKIDVRGDNVTIDFTGTGSVSSGNLNANRSIVTAAVLYAFRCLMQEEIPLNSGVLKPISIMLPPSILNPPAYEDPSQCPAVVGGNVETSSRVIDVLLGALVLAAASQGTMNNLTFGDESFGYYETICGGSGATESAHGADAVHTHMTNTRLTDPEVIEHRYPVRIREFSIRENSGGPGKHKGGEGICRRIEFLKPLDVSLLTERRGPYPPFGLQGGEPGALGKNLIQRAGQSDTEMLSAKVQLKVQVGDVLTILTPGGGGYGQADS